MAGNQTRTTRWRSQRVRRTVHPSATAAALIAVASFAAGACGSATSQRVEPLGGGARHRATTTAAPATPDESAIPGTSAPSAPAPSEPGVTPGPSTTPPTTTADDRSTWSSAATTVDDVLVRFDRVVTRFHSDPSVFGRGTDPLLAEWASVVPPGAVLADDIATQVRRRLRSGEAIPANGDALAYVHHVTAATAETDEQISFTWCSWSPGVVRHTSTGEVVDDVVGHSTGTGIVNRIDGAWMLSSLDEVTYEGLPPNSTDPCPTRPTNGAGR